MTRLFFTWDDGHPDDFLLKELHERYEIPCMLFIPAENREGRDVMTPQNIAEIKSELIEIGAHTYHHVYLTEIDRNSVQSELINGKKYLEDITGCSIKDFCFPGGRCNSEILRESLAVYKTVRLANTMRTKQAFPVVDTTFHFYPRGWKSILFNSLKQRSGNILFPALSKCHKTDYFDFITYYIQKAFADRNDDDIVIYGHSWELSDFNLWEKLENLFKCIVSLNIKCRKYSEIC